MLHRLHRRSPQKVFPAKILTSGPSGFLHILPVYLDHILYPTLREEDYLTEVHHINGEGQDTGVVYSEMQVRQNHGLHFACCIYIAPHTHDRPICIRPINKCKFLRGCDIEPCYDLYCPAGLGSSG